MDTTEPEVQEIAFDPNAPTVYTAGSTLEVIVTFEEGKRADGARHQWGYAESDAALRREIRARDSQKTALKAEYKEAPSRVNEIRFHLCHYFGDTGRYGWRSDRK